MKLYHYSYLNTLIRLLSQPCRQNLLAMYMQWSSSFELGMYIAVRKRLPLGTLAYYIDASGWDSHNFQSSKFDSPDLSGSWIPYCRSQLYVNKFMKSIRNFDVWQMASAFAIFAFQRTGPTLPPHKWIVVFSLSTSFGSLYFSLISSGILTRN